MSVTPEEYQLISRTDAILAQRQVLVSRLKDRLIDASFPSYDRLSKLTIRVDFWSNVYEPPKRPVIRRVSLRVSEVTSGYSFTRFMEGKIAHTAYGASFNDLSAYDKVMLTH